MRAAFVVFDRMTSLDFVGVFDPLGRLRTMEFLPEFNFSICSMTSVVKDDRGLTMLPDSVGKPLSDFDLVIVPGGYGVRDLQRDDAFLQWLRTAHDVPLKASVCTGSILLGAAGFLVGKTATTHPSAKDELLPFCANVVDDRIVDEGDIVTAGGVTASIDLGLHLVTRLTDQATARRIATQMDYRHDH